MSGRTALPNVPQFSRKKDSVEAESCLTRLEIFSSEGLDRWQHSLGSRPCDIRLKWGVLAWKGSGFPKDVASPLKAVVAPSRVDDRDGETFDPSYRTIR